MKLPCYLAIPAAIVMSVPGALAQAPEAFGQIDWKKVAQELSKDPAFQADAKKILAVMVAEKKQPVNKAIAQMVAGKGIMVTGTPFDDLLVTSLKKKAKEYVGESGSAYLERMSQDEILALMTGTPLDELEEKANEIPQIARIHLASDPTVGLDPEDSGRAGTGKRAARIRIVPGLADPKQVSLEQGRDRFLLHRDWKIWVEKRPDDARDKRIFEANATFRIVRLPDKSVRFEANNRQGEFLMVEEDGKLSLARPSNPDRTAFRIIPAGPKD